MKAAYVDASLIVGLHFHEPAAAGSWRRIKSFDRLVSSSLIVAEVLAALRREDRPLHEADTLLGGISLFSPEASLHLECTEALEAGPLRGADLWHVACALAIAGPRQRKALSFLTLDDSQEKVAASLGFSVTRRPLPPRKRRSARG